VLAVAPEQVHIVPSAIGGGFGGKLDLSVQPLLAVAAWKLGRAVRLVYERPESMQSSTKRHPSRLRGRAACDAAGHLTAYDFHGDFDTGAYSSWGPTVANRVPIHASGPYRVPHVRALTRAVHTNGSVCGAFRGFGVPQSTLLGELLLDELAGGAGIDALEFRHRNALRAGDTTPTGQVLAASVGLRACLDALRPTWQAAATAASAFNERTAASPSPLRRGAGIACMWYGIGNTVIANPSTMRGALRWDDSRGGHLFLYNGAQEIGQGTATIIPQMFADAVGLPLAGLQQVMGDTDLTADAGKSSASRQTFVSGNAARAAGRDLRRQLLERMGWPGEVDGATSATVRGASSTCAPSRPRQPGPISSSASATSTRRPSRSTPTGRACRTRPTRSRRRSPRSRSTSSSARSGCCTSTPRTTSAGRSTRPKSRARSTAASPRASAWR
jgi:CO/xanthine dehydrogenase Mo-binding subunit